MKLAGLAGLLAALAAPALAAAPPQCAAVDAPELACRGSFDVGIRTLRLVERDAVDAAPLASGTAATAHVDRVLEVELWYPARLPANAHGVLYRSRLPSEPPALPAEFSFEGIAVRDAPPALAQLPLVIVSHGYSNDPLLLTWLTENLASKGYVVAAIRHADPPLTDRAQFGEVLLRRPLDIAFVARTLPAIPAVAHLVDATRTALVGYSIGGYGVLTAAGGVLDPNSPAVASMVPRHLLSPYARGGGLQESIVVRPLRAVVAISPAGGGAVAAWGSSGLQGIHAPLLLIAGDVDRTVDYHSGARAFFDAAVNAPRYLLTYHLGGHALGLNPVPAAMRGTLWDQDWFEDPVWRKERIVGINTHFITAFLDRYVKGDESRAAYLNVAVTDSTSGVWPPSQPASAYDAYSPGPGVAGVTLWKGFQRNHATGLELLRAGD